jgi:dihydrofolate reductase
VDASFTYGTQELVIRGEMRRLILFMHMSLDGYVAAADKASGLITADDDTADNATDDDGVMETVVPKLTSDADTLLLGRVVANELLGYWLTAETNDPNLSSGALAYARWATGAHKAVISNTKEQLLWGNSELLLVRNDEDMVRAVSALKRQPGKSIVVHGGVRTVQALARLNLIDEYQLVVHPEAQGDGRRLFKDLPDSLKLQLIEVVALKAGGIFLRYRPKAVA